jgi:hypothetical protein
VVIHVSDSLLNLNLMLTAIKPTRAHRHTSHTRSLFSSLLSAVFQLIITVVCHKRVREESNKSLEKGRYLSLCGFGNFQNWTARVRSPAKATLISKALRESSI